MNQKRLIIFIPSIEGGGVEKNLFIISDFLTKKINDISVITISKRFKKKFNKKIKLISPKLNFWDTIGRRKKFFLSLLLLAIEIFKDRNLLVFCFQGNIYCTLLCKLLGVKIIVRSNSAPDGWSQNIFKFYCFKYIFKLANEIIVNSLDFKKKFKSNFDLESVCIYNPLNKKEILAKSKLKTKFKFSKNKINLINVGRFTEQKDQITLLKAVNFIKKKIKFNLLIVGYGKKKNDLINYINQNNLQTNVKIVSYQNNPYNLIKSSDIFILSSLYEGLPNVLIEAQALKKFIISSDCPTGPREILLDGKAGYLFKIKNYKSLSKLILKILKNKNDMNKKISVGYKSLNRFDYNLNLNKYYKTVLRYL
tara:strand:- start:521 stop:1615 length:1095 start_codon:yes stop_codon:yes gene_type:complete